MAGGMSAWVTKTLEFLIHPLDSPVRPSLENSLEPERLLPARRESPPRARWQQRRGNRSRQTRSQAHATRFPVNVSNAQTQASVGTDNRSTQYVNHSTQTDEMGFLESSRSNLLVEQPDETIKQHVNASRGGVPHDSPGSVATKEHMECEMQTLDNSSYHDQRPEAATQDAEMLEGPPYTDGIAQLVLANDGQKNCLAVLLTSEMVTKFNQIATRSRRLEYITNKLRQVKREIASEKNMVEYKRDALQDTEDQAELAQINEHIDEIQTRIAEAAKSVNTLEEEIDTLTVNLAYNRDQSQEMFEDVLGRMDLLNVPEPEFAKEVDHAGSLDYGTEPILSPKDISSAEPHYGDEALSSRKFDDADRRAAKLEFEDKRNILIAIDEAFEHRQENLAEEKAEYRRCVREGTCQLTQTEFDLLALEDFRRMTADLRDAQEAFEASFRRAKHLGALDERDAHYQESVFSDWSGGYPMSMESAMKESAPTKSIAVWQEGVKESLDRTAREENENEPLANPDLESEVPSMENCDLKSVAISDSWSCVDWSRNRRRIEQWRAIAGRER